MLAGSDGGGIHSNRMCGEEYLFLVLGPLVYCIVMIAAEETYKQKRC